MLQGMKSALRLIGLLVAGMCTLACGPGAGGGGGGGGAQISARLNAGGTASGGALTRALSPAPSPFSAGQTTATSLRSMKYAIIGISICEDLTTSGTGFSNQSNCLTLYQGPEVPTLGYDPANYDPAALMAAARALSAPFIDLLSPTSRAALSTPHTLTAADAHDYNWGIITWYLPIKITADIPMNDGSTFRTQDGTLQSQLNPDGIRSYWTEIAGAFENVSTAEEAVVLHGNGGTWFRFQKPFTITQADVTSSTNFVLDLTFNPAGLIKGFKGTSSATSILRDSAGSGISIPMIDLTPVAHKESDQVIKSTYLASVSASGLDNSQSVTDHFDVRYELYSLASDPQHAIYGVDVKTLVNTQTSRWFFDAPKVSFLETAGDGSLTFEGWDHSPMTTGFQVQSTVGATTAATLKCGGGAGFAIVGCGAPVGSGPQGSYSATFTLTGQGPL
jgi:hypothetical protein